MLSKNRNVPFPQDKRGKNKVERDRETMVYDELDYHEYGDYEYLLPEGEEEYKPDPYFLQAKDEIEKLYNADKEAVFYMRQIQVKYEKEFYHWITRNAITSLVKEGFLKQINFSVSSSGNPLNFHFFVHHTNRYPKRDINYLANIVAEFSQSHIMLSCGNRAEILFAEGLASRGFMPILKKVTEYEGKKWTRTKHDLDYVFKKDNMVYGCEIKNTLAYIDKDELEIKLEMCKHFNITPLFIMRYSPKTYNDLIINNKGLILIFKAQIYDLSQKELVQKIKENLGYEVDCPKAIPGGILDRFERLHNKLKNT